MTKSKDHPYRDQRTTEEEDKDQTQDEIIVLQRAMRLQNIYIALKIRYQRKTFWRKSKNPAVLETFKKVAKTLIETEQESKEEIQDELYVAAIFLKYGYETQPGHLLGKNAYAIYRERLGQLVYTKYTPKKNLDEETLKYLCEARGETPAETIWALRNSGLFSQSFIKKWEKKRGRKV
jgi:hypothetical protein